MTRSSYRAWCGVIGRVLPKPAALMREALSETLPIRIATGEIWAYLPVSSDEGMAAGSGTSCQGNDPQGMKQGVNLSGNLWFQFECKIAPFQAIYFTICHRDYEVQIYTKTFNESNIHVNIFYQTLCPALQIKSRWTCNTACLMGLRLT